MNTPLLDQTPPEPLSIEEQAHYRKKAELGETPTLDIVRRWVATMRKSILASPTKTANAKKGRNKKVVATEDDVGKFF